ncbi:hypothetical protein OIU78_026818 [Salix suchowensis]|nr:hypothetical protein OIU78_026818 [Salix suchowensis]
MIYCYFAYIGIVKNKDFPHFFRFGMYYWAGVGFSYITILLQCVRFALAGDYAHLSFVSDAAYVHTLFNIGELKFEMRRRPVDSRRPVRRRISNVVVWSLCGIFVLLFIVILSKDSRIESRPSSSIKIGIVFWSLTLRELDGVRLHLMKGLH